MKNQTQKQFSLNRTASKKQIPIRRQVVIAIYMLCCSLSFFQAWAKDCKPDVSRTDKITKQQKDIWVQKVFATSLGSSIWSETAHVSIYVSVGRYGSANAVNVEILKAEESLPSAVFESSLRAVKGNRFFLAFKEGGEPLTFVATEVGNETKVRNDVLDFGKGKVVTSVVLSSAVSDETLATLQDALTKKPVDAVRVFLAGDVIIEKSVSAGDGKKLMDKFSCFYQSLDKRGVSLSAGGGPQSQPAPANDPTRKAAVQGRYARKGKSTDFIELNADGTSGLRQDGNSTRGNYTVQGDTISFTTPEMPGLTIKSHVTGNTIKDDEGIIWEKMTEAQRAAAPPLPIEPEPSKDAVDAVSGMYILKSDPRNFIEVKPDGTVATQLGGKAGVGIYKAKGDKIHFEIKKGPSVTFRLKGNTMVGTTQVWEKQAAETSKAEAPRVATTPVTLRLGMTPEQVEAAQGGQPQKVIDLGSKKIYVYSDMKITFVDGKVSDIQ